MLAASNVSGIPLLGIASCKQRHCSSVFLVVAGLADVVAVAVAEAMDAAVEAMDAVAVVGAVVLVVPPATHCFCLRPLQAVSDDRCQCYTLSDTCLYISQTRRCRWDTILCAP